MIEHSNKMRLMLPTLAISLLLTAILAVTSESSAAQKAIRHSDVVLMGENSKDIYDIYGITVVSWGGRAWEEKAGAIEDFRKRVQTAHDCGIRYCAGAAFRTAFAGMIDFDPKWSDSRCLTIEGKPVLVPWLWDQKHKDGHPAYWFCTNAPGYREYLKWQVRTGMTAKVEGLHIDDYGGTSGTEWLGACFCPHCMKAFTEYLKKNVAPERLTKYGIASLDGFNYGQFLKTKGIVKVDDFRRILGSPEHLGPDYVRFQYFASADFIGEVRKYAEQLVGHPLLLSVNSGVTDPKSLAVAPQVSYFCGEVDHGTEKNPWGPKNNVDLQPVWTFKLADAIGRFQACTASGQDWAFVDANKKPGLVRRWIAQDYAFGHCLMAPHRQWAYTEKKGTHWYQSRPEDFAHVYRFVQRNKGLFDDYEAVAPVGLLYSSAGAAQNVGPTRDACLWLAKNSIPFELVPAGNDWLDAKLTPPTLAKYRALVVAEPTLLDGEQKQALEQFKASGKVVAWDAQKGLDEAALARLLPKQIVFSAADHLIGVARAIPGNPTAPIIVHLLNRNYDESADAAKKLQNVKVTLHKDLFSGRQPSKATLFTPPATLDRKDPGNSTPVSLRIELAEGGIVVTVPELDYWGILKLE